MIVIHVAAQNWYTLDVHTFEWQAINFWHGSIVRWAVPVFVMMSGALFLSRDIPIRKLYSKYMFRIFTAFIFWSFVYAVKNYVKSGDILKATGLFVQGDSHMWFLFMIAGLYMIVPFMKKIAESESLSKYFLALAFITVFLLPNITQIISLSSEKLSKFFVRWFNTFDINLVAGFTGYFLLGYILNRASISPKTGRIIYSLGLAGFVAGMVLSVTASMITSSPNQTFYHNLTLSTLFESAAVFVFFKANLNWPSRLIRMLSQYSFGAYLVHVAVISALKWLGLNTLTFNPLFSVPVISVIVFVISFVISAILNHIPILNKYIV